MMSTFSLNRRSLLSLVVGTSAAVCSRGFSAEESLSENDLRYDTGTTPVNGNVQLQAIGALGVGHIQSTLGLIGVIADSLTKEIYSIKQVEDLMNGTINGLESPKRMLRRLQDSNISSDDAEFLDRMIGVLNALQREAKALAVYTRSRKQDDAAQFEKARRMALKKLGELTQQEELLQSEPATRNLTNPKTGKVGEANN